MLRRLFTLGLGRAYPRGWGAALAWFLLGLGAGLLLMALAGCSGVYDSQTPDSTRKESLRVQPQPFTVAPDGRISGGACFRSEAHE